MRIAITGTIGSGKTTVAKILEEKGYTVLYTDIINAGLLGDPIYINKIREVFPNAVSFGKIDKKKLSEEVFSNEENRKKLNGIAHPIIKKKIERILSVSEGTVFVEIPLLVESGMEELFDEIWLVRSDENKQIMRVADRDGRPSEQTARIIQAQRNEDSYHLPVRIIDNNGDVSVLSNKIDEILN